MQAIPHYLCLEVAIYFLSLPLGWPCPSLKLPLFSRSRKKRSGRRTAATLSATKKRKEWSGKLSINQISWGYFQLFLPLLCSLPFFCLEQMLCQELSDPLYTFDGPNCSILYRVWYKSYIPSLYEVGKGCHFDNYLIIKQAII